MTGVGGGIGKGAPTTTSAAPLETGTHGGRSSASSLLESTSREQVVSSTIVSQSEDVCLFFSFAEDSVADSVVDGLGKTARYGHGVM